MENKIIYWKFPKIIISNISSEIIKSIKELLNKEKYKKDIILNYYNSKFFYIEVISLEKAKILFYFLKKKYNECEVLLPIKEKDIFYNPMIGERFIRKTKDKKIINELDFPILESKEKILTNKKQIYDYFNKYKKEIKVSDIILKYENINLFTPKKLIIPEELKKTEDEPNRVYWKQKYNNKPKRRFY